MESILEHPKVKRWLEAVRVNRGMPEGAPMPKEKCPTDGCTNEGYARFGFNYFWCVPCEIASKLQESYKQVRCPICHGQQVASRVYLETHLLNMDDGGTIATYRCSNRHQFAGVAK